MHKNAFCYIEYDTDSDGYCVVLYKEPTFTSSLIKAEWQPTISALHTYIRTNDWVIVWQLSRKEMLDLGANPRLPSECYSSQ